jgi:hypothetical protein
MGEHHVCVGTRVPTSLGGVGVAPRARLGRGGQCNCKRTDCGARRRRRSPAEHAAQQAYYGAGSSGTWCWSGEGCGWVSRDLQRNACLAVLSKHELWLCLRM